MYLFPDSFPDPTSSSLAQLRESGFQVKETLLEQGSGPVNEDALATVGPLSIVCDGATSLTGDQHQPAKPQLWGGREAARITTSVFSSAPEEELLHLARRANDLIRERMVDHGLNPDQREQLWSTSFAAVQVSGNSVHWCQTGDCMIVLIRDDGSCQLLTDLPGQDREVLKQWQRIGASSTATIHQALRTEIAAVRRKMNREFGVLNGEAEALGFISSGTVQDEQITDLLLFSDGLFPPSSHPDDPFNIELLVQLYKKGGLANIRRHVRALQHDDPGCYRYPRFKRYDDISAIALTRNVA